MTKSLKTFLESLLFLLLIAFAIVLSTSKNFSAAVLEGINLWVACVLPALFPYFFITAILSSLSVTGKISNALTPLTTRLFNVSGAVGYALFISLISGYPTGAKTVADLKENGIITETESVRAAALCSSSSPMFTIGSVGNLMFNSSLFGALLLFSHFLAVITTGIIFSFYKRKDRPQKTPRLYALKKLDNLLYESTFSAVISILIVGGLITVFYLLTEVFLSFNLLNPLINFFNLIFKDQTIAKGLTLGIFEYTRGLKILSQGGISAISLSISAFLISLSGLSIMAQSIAYLKKAKIKTAPFLLSKALSAVLSALFGFIFSLFL